MSDHVKSHRAARRKRRLAPRWNARHAIAVLVALAAILAATWFAPDFSQPAPVARSAATEATRPAQASAPLAAVDIAADLASPSPARARHARRDSGIPLDANAPLHSDGYEILSASELADISQARD